MANTYVQIGTTVTVGAGTAASIDFTSIPATFTDLVIRTSARTTSNAGQAWGGLRLAINGVTTNLTFKALYGDGSNASAGSGALAEVGLASSSASTASAFGNSECYIPNYANTSYNKSFSADGVQENNAASALLAIDTNLWSNTAAITSLSIQLQGGVGNFAQYSTAALYGIKNS
jgi:hypothetical protein